MRLTTRKRRRWAIHVMAVLFVLGGCAPSLTPSSRQEVVENRPQTMLRVIREFFEENPPDEVEVTMVFYDVNTPQPRWEQQRLFVEALRRDTRPVDTGQSEVVLLAARGIVNFDGSRTSLLVGLSSLGFSLGSTYRYRFDNPSLAGLLLKAYERAGPPKGLLDRHLRHCLKVAAGEPSELPELTDGDRRIRAEQERQRSYCYTMTDEEMAALDEARAFVGAGGDVDALILEDPADEDGQKQTRLHRAAKEGFRTVAECLLLHGANPNVVDSVGLTPLDWAAKRGHRACAALLILRGADVNRGVRLSGRTPLLEVAGGYGDRQDPRRVEIVEMLLGAGADVNVANRFGTTPLHQATSYGRLEIVALLIAAGANIEAKDEHGRTPLQEGISGFQPEAAMLLLRKGAKPDLYLTGVPFRPEWVAEFLDKYPEVVNISGPDGNRPLHYAAMKGQADIVLLLLKRGAEVGARNKAGETALDLARTNSQEAVVELLKAHGAKE
jgi:ankyrin repeat protein